MCDYRTQRNPDHTDVFLDLVNKMSAKTDISENQQAVFAASCRSRTKAETAIRHID